jgi:hypothetical protein
MFWAKHYTFDWNITILLQYYCNIIRA